jgi:RNA polymerase sigma-70 factor, ECF subfamily
MAEHLESEQEYVVKAQGGDGQAFGVLYDHYAPAIYRFIALKVSTRQEAEDLLHEVFLSAWQNLPGFKEQGFPLSSWLYKIARNRVIDYYRTKKQATSIDDEESGVSELQDVSPAAAIEQALDERLEMDEVKDAIAQLPSEQREVIELRFLADLSPIEIAGIIGKREGTVRIIQFRALKKLKEILGE